MRNTSYAKLFMIGRSQAVRLPKAFRMPGNRVRIRKMGNGVLIEPVTFDTKAWFAKLDKFRSVPFMPEGRTQPMAQKRRFFD